MTYTMKVIPPKKFLTEFCGEDLRQYVVDTLTSSQSFKLSEAQLDDLVNKSRPESYLLAAFIMDWYAVREQKGGGPFFFRSGRWFWYPERRVALPAEALPGLLFTGDPDSLDFDYVHTDRNDVDRTDHIGSLEPHPRIQGMFRSQIKPLMLEAGYDFDKAIWKLAQSQYPIHLYNTAAEEMWCVNLWFSFSLFKELSLTSRSLDGKL